MSARNEITGSEYQGKNIDRLTIAELEHGYDDTRGWAGFRQWLDSGRVVRKGEHGTPCMTVVTVGEEGAQTRKPRGFRVFHYDQTDEISAEKAERVEAACAFPVGPDLNRSDLRAEGQEIAERKFRVVATPAFGQPSEIDVSEPDNSSEASEARRAMFKGFGWSVTQ